MRTNIWRKPGKAVIPVAVEELCGLASRNWNDGAWDEWEADASSVEVATCTPMVTYVGVKCSACGKWAWKDVDSITPYCPECGRMVVKG